MNKTKRDGLLARSIGDLDYVTGTELVGTTDSAQKKRRLDLAQERINAFVKDQGPTNKLGPQGGSSSPVEDEDRQEDNKVSRQAALDALAADRLVQVIADATDELQELVRRNVTSIDHSKLPRTPTVVGCRSCERVKWDDGVKRGGHFEPVMPAKDEGTTKGNKKAAAAGLCRWCWRHASAEAAEADAIDEKGDPVVRREHWPPIEICDLRHRQGERAAGVELAKRRKQKAA